MHNESSVFMWETSSGHFEPIARIANSYENFLLTLANFDLMLANFDKMYDYDILEVQPENTKPVAIG